MNSLFDRFAQPPVVLCGLVCLILSQATDLRAQELPFTHYTVDSELNPLPSASVSRVYRDTQGFMWMVVYSSGLIRYDGHEMELYDTGSGLKSEYVMNLVQGKNGHLWVMARDGVSVSSKPLHSYKAGQRVSFMTEVGGVALASQGLSESMAVDDEGRVWVGGAWGLSGYLLREDGSLETRTISITGGDGNALAVEAVGYQEPGLLWAGTEGNQLARVDLGSGTVQVLSLWDKGKCQSVTAMFTNSQKALYGGCLDGAVFRIPPSGIKNGKIDWLLGSNGSKVAGLSEDRSKYIWVASRGAGFTRLPNSPNEEAEYLGRENGLLSEGGEAVMEDDEGTYWFAQTGGISKLRANSRAFRNLTANSRGGTAPALPSPGVRSVRTTDTDKSSTLWIATGLGLVVKSHDTSDLLGAADGLGSDNIWLLCSDHQGRMWVNSNNSVGVILPKGEENLEGFETRGTTTINGERRVVLSRQWYRSRACSTVKLPNRENGQLRADATCFGGKKEMTCWVDGAWLTFGPEAGIPDSEIQSQYYDESGRFWIGTRGSGIYTNTSGNFAGELLELRKSGETTKANLFEKKLSVEEGLPSDSIQAMEQVGNQILIASNRGLTVVDSKTHRVSKTLSNEEGLPHPSVFSMDLSPVTGHLWLGTNGGLAEYDPASGKIIRSVTKQHGLLNNEVWWHQSVFVSSDGTIHYGTSAGLARFQPRENKSNLLPPEPVFRSVDYRQDESGNNELHIRFSALSFADERSVLYKTRVIGYRDQWSSPTSQNVLQLMNLPAVGFPKVYAVEVLASNNDGVWSLKPIRTSFTVNPPWWLRWYVIGVFLGLTGTVTYRVFQSRVKRLTHQRSELELEVRKQTAEAVMQRAAAEQKADEASDALMLMEQAFANFKVVADIGSEVSGTLDIEEVFEKVYGHLNSMVVVDAFGIATFNQQDASLTYVFTVEEGERQPVVTVPVNKSSPAGWAVLNRDVVLVSEGKNDLVLQGFEYKVVSGRETESILYQPIIRGDEVLGVVTVQAFKRYAYVEHHTEIIRTIANYIGAVLSNVAAFDENQRMQIKLIEQEKMTTLGDLVAGIAHELNSPLGVVTSGNDLIKKMLSKPGWEEIPDDLAKFLPRIESKIENNDAACKRMSKILASLRHFVRLDQAEMQEETPSKLLDDTLTVVNHQVRNIVEIQRDYQTDATIRCFPGRLNQVFLNIITNAKAILETTEDGRGTLRISVENGRDVDGNDIVNISFRDNGPGIPLEAIPKLFNPGFSTKGSRVSSGLGLSICRTIITEHGGTIFAMNREDTHGAIFKIILPAQNSRLKASEGEQA